MTGSPRVLTLSDGELELELSSRELDWRVHSIGPVLPVIPNFIGGGMEPEPTLALHLHVAECAAPVKVLRVRTRVKPADGAVLGTLTCLAGDAPWTHESSEPAALDHEDPILRRGGGVWLVFDVECAGVDAFELALALETERGAPIEAAFTFERSNATFYVLAWWAPDSKD